MEALLYKPTEAQEMLKLGRSKIYQLIASKELRTVREGRAIRIPASALKEYVQRKEQEAKAQGREPEQSE